MNTRSSKPSDEYETPGSALDMIIPHLPRDKILFEPFPGTGAAARYLIEKGFNVRYELDRDFFQDYKARELPEFDFIITNPPFSWKKEFISILKEIGKPFIILLPANAINLLKIFSEVQYEAFKQNLIIPTKRIMLIRDGETIRNHNFLSVWIHRTDEDLIPEYDH